MLLYVIENSDLILVHVYIKDPGCRDVLVTSVCKLIAYYVNVNPYFINKCISWTAAMRFK